MLANGKMTELAERRQELLIQSEVNRRMLTAQCSELTEAASWLDACFSIVQKIRPYGVFLAPVLGFLAARFGRRPGGTAGKIESAVRLFETMQRVWRGLFGSSPKP